VVDRALYRAILADLRESMRRVERDIELYEEHAADNEALTLSVDAQRRAVHVRTVLIPRKRSTLAMLEREVVEMEQQMNGPKVLQAAQRDLR